MSNRASLLIDEEAIYINDDDGEVVMWDKAEWVEDPSLVPTIAIFINEALTDGTVKIRIRTGHVPGYDGAELNDRVYRWWWARLRKEPKQVRAKLPANIREFYGFDAKGEDIDDD